ncbi:MAG: hypothetical protein ACM3JI_05300 [Anaerolineae bacterium]
MDISVDTLFSQGKVLYEHFLKLALLHPYVSSLLGGLAVLWGIHLILPISLPFSWKFILSIGLLILGLALAVKGGFIRPLA